MDPLVNITVSLANELPHAVRELDYVLRGKSFSTTTYVKRLPLGKFEMQLDPEESGHWLVLISLHAEDFDHLALT